MIDEYAVGSPDVIARRLQTDYRRGLKADARCVATSRNCQRIVVSVALV
jgi:hypothetical protein